MSRKEAAAALSYTQQIAAARAREDRTADRIVAERQQAAADAAEAAAAAEAARLQAIEDAEAAAAAQKVADAQAFAARKAATYAAESALNEYSVHRESYKNRLGPDGHRFQIRSKASDPKAYRFGANTKAFSPGNNGFCMAVPEAATAKGGWRDGLSVSMAPCDDEDDLQFFSFDPVSSYIHPEPTRSWCLDYAPNPKGFKALRVQWCDKKHSVYHGDGHQRWQFANNSKIQNEDTSLCVTTGLGDVPGRVFTGKTVQQYTCDSTALEQLWTWLPRGGAYKAMELGRLWVN